MLCVGLIVKPLALKIANLYIVTIHKHKMANSGARESGGRKAAQSTASNYRNSRPQEAFLTVFTKGSEAYLPRVTFPHLGSHTTRW